MCTTGYDSRKCGHCRNGSKKCHRNSEWGKGTFFVIFGLALTNTELLAGDGQRISQTIEA
jgi:hypothetical protein